MTFHTSSAGSLGAGSLLSVWAMLLDCVQCRRTCVCSGGRSATPCTEVVGTWMVSFDPS